jgi:hypothetical protein
MDVQNGEEHGKDVPVSHDSISRVVEEIEGDHDRRPRHETRLLFCDPLAQLLVDLELAQSSERMSDLLPFSVARGRSWFCEWFSRISFGILGDGGMRYTWKHVWHGKRMMTHAIDDESGTRHGSIDGKWVTNETYRQQLHRW